MIRIYTTALESETDTWMLKAKTKSRLKWIAGEEVAES